jgi:hypothetical protein
MILEGDYGAVYQVDWLAYAPGGGYDGSEAGRTLVTFRAGEIGELLSEEQMAKDFYRPVFLGEILTSKREQ